MEDLLPSIGGWALTGARLLGLTLAIPFFSGRILPFRSRVALSAILAVPLSGGLPADWTSPPLLDLGFPGAAGRLGLEALTGFALGWSARLVLEAVRGAGTFISDQIGFSLGGALDPHLAPPEPALRMLHGAFAIHVFFCLDFHHACIRAVSESLRALPPGSVASPEAVERAGRTVIASGSTLFEAALTAAFPLTAALILAALAQGIAARIFPRFEVFLFGFPTRAVLGLGVAALSLPYLAACSAALYAAAGALGSTFLEALGG
jgi:flagellar biosynthetic protein FliR